MKKLFLYKILPVFSLFMLVLFSLTSSCFAGYTTNDDGSVTVELPDGKSYKLTSEFFNGFKYVVYGYYFDNDNNLMESCYYSNNPMTFDINPDVGYYISGDTFYGIFGSVHSYPLEVPFSGNSLTSPYSSHIIPLYSTYDVYSSDGQLVFPPAPPQEEAPQVELMKPTQLEEIPQQIAGVVEIALPIFLAIFGILLVLYLIKSKNLLHL